MDHEVTPARQPRFAGALDVDAAAVDHSLVNELMALGSLGPIMARHRRQSRRARLRARLEDHRAMPGRRYPDRSAAWCPR